MPSFAIERKQGLADLVDDIRLDAFGRLVEQKNLRIDGKRTGDRELLLLSAGQETCPAVEIGLQVGEHLEADLGDLRATVVARESPQQNVFADGEFRKNSAPLRNVAEPELGPEIGGRRIDVLAFDDDIADGTIGQPHDRPHQRGLADAIAAQHAKALALFDPEREILQDRRLAVVGGDAIHRQKHGHASSVSPR